MDAYFKDETNNNNEIEQTTIDSINNQGEKNWTGLDWPRGIKKKKNKKKEN